MDAIITARSRIFNWGRWLGLGLAVLLIALALAWTASQFQNLQGWGSYLAVLLLGSAILLGGWLLVKREAPPRWLAALLVGAAILRLAVGVLWYVALPVAGHGSQEEMAGYVMADASERDQAAWQLGNSNKSLFEAFGKFRKADQYGGFLFISALLYRYLGGSGPQPLLMVGVAAAFSSLAILFAWAIARRAWGTGAAVAAASILAIYPEAVLLGSSQMREAFTITLAAAAFYGLVRYGQDRSWGSLAWILGALMLNLPISPPLSALLIAMMVLTALVMGRRMIFGEHPLRQWQFWLLLAGVLALVLLGLYLAWRQFVPREGFDLVGVISLWIRKSAEWQAHLTRRASGWIQKIFHGTPDWTHLPLLVAYGVVQPFLPAAIIAPSDAPIWQWIAIWRAAGWTLLLPVLIYAPLRAWTQKGTSRFTRGVTLAIWLVILAASYRGGGDQWDNSRYRVAFAGIQVAVAAWAWSTQRSSTDPWLKRILIGVGLVLAWFIPWYTGRYTAFDWVVNDVFKTLGLGLASAALFFVWDWARRKSPS